MKILQANIPTSLGDIINLKCSLDKVKHEYSEISLTYHTDLWKTCLKLDVEKEKAWRQYLLDLTGLLFSETPYVINKSQHKFYTTVDLMKKFNIQPVQPRLPQLCKGTSLDIGKYVIITTKVRGVDKLFLFQNMIHLIAALRNLSSKYKIVILGEREVEMRKEYEIPQLKNQIFGIYDQIVANVDNVLDLTVPALGNTQSSLSNIQQDCLYMKEAHAVINIGIGGNLALSMASANCTIGFYQQTDWLGEKIFQPSQYVQMTNNWKEFIDKIKAL